MQNVREVERAGVHKPELENEFHLECDEPTRQRPLNDFG